MQYEMTGGLEQGIHYTRFIEETENDEQTKIKESAVKSHGETQAEKLDTE